mmetsp:Transcript_1906/g.5234  ORF Transcript_1906/g.5234 Transcript_1906/m.5234 type:complete len:285 (-) Transcript_1906:390-1244(-)
MYGARPGERIRSAPEYRADPAHGRRRRRRHCPCLLLLCQVHRPRCCPRFDGPPILDRAKCLVWRPRRTTTTTRPPPVVAVMLASFDAPHWVSSLSPRPDRPNYSPGIVPPAVQSFLGHPRLASTQWRRRVPTITIMMIRPFPYYCGCRRWHRPCRCRRTHNRVGTRIMMTMTMMTMMISQRIGVVWQSVGVRVRIPPAFSCPEQSHHRRRRRRRSCDGVVAGRGASCHRREGTGPRVIVVLLQQLLVLTVLEVVVDRFVPCIAPCDRPESVVHHYQYYPFRTAT